MDKPNKTNALLAMALIAGVLTVIGCSQPPPVVVTETPEIPGYTNLNREFGPLDFSPLTGRRIVIDPGHGGYFRGAVGPGGLSEAEVNLGVALYLRGLLEWAGAEVFMTRSADYDFLSPADSTLSSDLAFRINFANELQPDVFISIHHNSTASADPTINETQTYYPIGQEDASLDLARSIHRHLVLSLEISPAKILPGNFHVLRHAEVPAVLGEPAMISNPVIEGRLSLAASQELEAQAYFLGLLDYFAGGSPSWGAAQSDTLFIDKDRPGRPLSWTFDPGDTPGSPGPDPSTYTLTLNGHPEPFLVSPDGFTVSWQPPSHSQASARELRISGRNLAGRSAIPARTLVLPLVVDYPRVNVSRESSRNSRHPHDLIWFQPGMMDEAKTPELGPREYWALIPATGSDPITGAQDFLAPQFSATRPEGLHMAQPDSGLSWRLLSVAGSKPELVQSTPPQGWQNRFFQRDWPRGLHPDRPAQLVQENLPVWMEAKGVLPLVDPDPRSLASGRTVSLADRYWVTDPLVPALFGAVIVLDPTGGGTVTDGIGPLGTRGSDINLETALQARKYLEGAGATVYLTRKGEYAPPAQDKIRLAGQVKADLFLTIGRSSDPGLITIAHHPGSTTGQIWAAALASATEQLEPDGGLVAVSVGPSWAYLLRHTACPALEIGLPPLSNLDREIQATDPAWSQAEARALLLSMAAALGEEEVLARTLNLQDVLNALPAALALTEVEWALLDGNFPWLAPRTIPDTVPTTSDSLSYSQGGNADGPGLPALLSRHTLEIHQGINWQLWLLDYADGLLRPRLMLEGP